MAYTFESCSFRGIGDWRVTWAAALGMLGSKGVGSGALGPVDQSTAAGNFAVDWNYHNFSSSTKGTMQLAPHDSRDAEGKVLNRTYMLSAEFTVSQAAAYLEHRLTTWSVQAGA